MLTPLHAHCDTPTCFSPQGTILREYFVSRVNKIREQMYIYQIKEQRWLLFNLFNLCTNLQYPDRLGPSGKFVENFTRLTCMEISVIRSSTVECYGPLNFKSGVV